MQVSGHPVKVAVCGVDPAAAEGSTRWLRARERGESQAGQAEWGAGVGASSHPACGKPAESPLLPAGISPAHPEPQLAGLHLPEELGFGLSSQLPWGRSRLCPVRVAPWAGWGSWAFIQLLFLPETLQLS